MYYHDEMNAFAGRNAVLLVTLCLFITGTVHPVQGIKPDCMADEAPPDERFSEEHYGEVGYVRDTCIEVARNLIRKLKLPRPTEYCTILANIQTSTFWPFCGWLKRKRGKKRTRNVNNRVMTTALDMVRDFNDEVSKEHEISDLEDQKIIIQCIDTAIARLTNSGVADENPQLINEIKRLKSTYCKGSNSETGQQPSETNVVRVIRQQQDEKETDGLADGEENQKEEKMKRWEISEEEKEFLQDLKREFPLHECVFDGSYRKLEFLLKMGVDVTKKDTHGNTALHLAAMLGQKDFVNLLLVKGAPIDERNLTGWTPLHEAISYGDRSVITSMVQTDKQRCQETMVRNRLRLLPRLEDIPDFYMELEWKLSSKVPLLFLILPADLWKIKKRGSSIRLDFRFLNLWTRGKMTVLFNGVGLPTASMFIINNDKKIYRRIEHTVCLYSNIIKPNDH